MKAPKMGRPKLPRKLAKGSLLSVRFTAEERKSLDAAAERTGLSLSQWARKTMLASANEGATD